MLTGPAQPEVLGVPRQILSKIMDTKKHSRRNPHTWSRKEDKGKNKGNPSKRRKPRKPSGPLTYAPFAIMMEGDKKP